MTEETKPLRVDLAAGANRREGFIGVDLHKTDCVDIVCDLQNMTWPFEDGTVDEVWCCHYIEHCSNLVHFWSELYRILKVGGTATIIAPYGKNNRAWQDPTHVRAIVEESFLYLDKNYRAVNKLTHYLSSVDFEFVVTYLNIAPEWMNRSEEAKAFAIRHYWNVVADIQAILKKRE